jgi:Recombinase
VAFSVVARIESSMPASRIGSTKATWARRRTKATEHPVGSSATASKTGTQEPAHVRAEALGPTIHKLRKAGFSIKAIARELNEREIRQGGKWHRTSVRRLLRRLKRLEFSSRTALYPEE